MKITIRLLIAFIVLFSTSSYAQEEIETLINPKKPLPLAGYYAAKVHKFTKIGGDFVNLDGLYGGWYINHKFLLGTSIAALTSDIPVAPQFSTTPGTKMSYAYAQAGLMAEYVLASSRAVHISFQMFTGTGFTTQYVRHNNHSEFKHAKDANWFFVSEPGVNVEFNIFKWMRVCPGISYRAAVGSNANGLKDRNISGTTLNLAVKFGKF